MTEQTQESQEYAPATRPAGTLELANRFRDYVQRRASITPTKERSWDVAGNQIQKILTAQTDDDVWDADEGGTISGRDALDIEFQCLSYDLAESADEFDAPLGVFALIKAVRLDTTEEIIINTGAPLIIAKLRMLEQREMLPCECVIRGTKARNGTVLKLRPVPVRTMQGVTAES